MVWNSILVSEFLLLRSPFFFLLIAHTTQFIGCCVFSIMDLWRRRIPLGMMKDTALLGVVGFVPFLVLLYWEIRLLEATLPAHAPAPIAFFLQFILCTLAGDLLHYLTHRLLHSNSYLRHHVHNVHHEYKGPLFGWIAMQDHPIEVIMNNVAIYGVFIAFAHPLVLWCFALVGTIHATFNHSGYHVSLGVPFTLTSNDHQLHHDGNSTKNYGNIFRFWDWLFNTYGLNDRRRTASIYK